MLVAIISDIHENFHNLALFYEEIREKNIAQIFCLGDLINAGIAKTLALSGIPVFTVRGNNDGTKVAITKLAYESNGMLSVSDEVFDTYDLDGKMFFLTHYPLLAKSIAKSGDYDVVCFGHSHEIYCEKIGTCLSLNPGSLGNFGTYAIYDTETHTAEICTLENRITMMTPTAKAYLEKIGSKREDFPGRKN